jgi:hypothetical protein
MHLLLKQVHLHSCVGAKQERQSRQQERDLHARSSTRYRHSAAEQAEAQQVYVLLSLLLICNSVSLAQNQLTQAMMT